ncbi:O-antigen ligase family protein [Dickeya zeae]|nr:O-antigen ligase family protein [Dickeya zeae]
MTYLKLFKNNIDYIIYFFILLFSSFSVFLSFLDVSYSRVFFYLASYLSFIFIFLSRFSLPHRFSVACPKGYKWLFGAIFLLGLSKLGWFYYEYVGSIYHHLDDAYFNAGKRLLLSAIIGVSLVLFSPLNTRLHKKIKDGLFALFVCCFLTASIVGVWQYLHGVERVDFLTRRATDGAYMYAALSMATMVIITEYISHWMRFVAVFIVFVISYTVILLTDTRNMVFAFPFIFFFTAFCAMRVLKIKWILVFFFLLISILCINYNKISHRVSDAVNETQGFENYNGNNSGSLSSRLAMWRLGMKFFIHHPLGSNKEARSEWARNYILTENKYQAALPYLDIHLHNEIIDTASLQGVLGVILLFLFYVSITLYAWVNKNFILLSVSAIIMTSGLTDVIFISREQTIFFTLMIVLALLWQRSCQSH